MGYASYTLPDGRAAGYAVAAACDKPDCTVKIDRGLAYLCGESPDGHRRDEEPGCGEYFCTSHDQTHDCPRPACGAYEEDGDGFCGAQLVDHDRPHRDQWDHHEFTETEPNEAPDTLGTHGAGTGYLSITTSLRSS